MPEIETKLTFRQTIRALGSVASTSFEVAPLLAVLQVVGAAISAGLPIATTYFAALTTTALASAYAGDDQAGERVLWYVAITAGLGLIGMAWQTFQSYMNEKMSYKIDSIMSDRMYDKFHAIEFWRYDDKQTVDSYEKAQRFAQFFPHIFQRLSDILTQILILFLSLWALLLVNPALSLVVLVAVLPSVVVQFKLSRLQAKHWRDNTETRRRISWIEWGMFRPSQMAELRLYGVVRHLLNMRLKLRDKDQKVRIDFERKFMLKRFGADVITAAAEAMALVWVTLEIIAHRQPIGQFLFVQQTVSRALGAVSSLVSTINSIDEDLANLNDYQTFMELPTPQVSKTKVGPMQQSLSLRDVSFHYPGSEEQVLTDINLSIKPAEHIALVGENGAGKTTLLKLITGLYAPSKGEVLLDGKNLADIDVASWHKQLGVLGQDFIRYDFATAYENVLFGNVSKPHHKSGIESALVAAEAADFVDKLPKGGDTYVDKWMESDDGTKGVDLSGGQWQRLALARNFYRDSSIIVLDEPTSAIDALAESRIFKRLFGRKDKTIITVSHRLTTIEKADVIYMLEHGRIVEQGSHDELVAKHGRYYRMFESQITG